VAPEAGQEFTRRMAVRLQAAGAGLERHFPELGAGGGVALLHYSYALIIGLWQMSPAAQGGTSACPLADAASPIFNYSYPDELDRALRALWEGTVGRPLQPASGRAKVHA
jgi:hypothetical protein